MQQDKTDWYWNGVLAGAVNNLYYDFINVDVIHVPYATHHRNSSFFLQTRRNYAPSYKWERHPDEEHKDWDVVDVKYVWNDNCKKEMWDVYTLLMDKSRKNIRLHHADIDNWCVQTFDWWRKNWHIFPFSWCWAYKLFVTDYVKWQKLTAGDILKMKDDSAAVEQGKWIQINKYDWWTTYWLFSDEAVEDWRARFRWPWEDDECPECWVSKWHYLLVYKSLNWENDWFAWQVRMITWMEWKRIMVDAPWQWFKTLTWDDEDEVKGKNVYYAIFPERWDVVWFTTWRDIRIINYADETTFQTQLVYEQDWLSYADIISVAEVASKVYVLTDNWYVHYANTWWYDKFFINDDMFAWVDKIALTSYRDILIAFWNKHIAVWVPDENGTYTTIYNQSSTVWLWSRYSYWEYDWDLIFVSNDRRLLALWIATNTSRYMLQYEDVWEMINGKLSILVPWDEVYIWVDNNDLRVFIQTKSMPYYNEDWDWQAELTTWYEYNYKNQKDEENKYGQENTMTRIIKFDKQFKVWTEDWIQWILLQWVDGWIYFWENWLYQRARWDYDWKWEKKYWFKSYISAYLIENESDWVWWTSSRLANRAKLYNLAKLNRLITTLWPWEYSNNTRIRITSYVQWLWSVYEFPVSGAWNNWLSLITTKYLWEEPDEEDMRKLECLNSVLQDNQKAYQPKCTGRPNAAIQNLAQTQPRCDNHIELLTLDKWVCIDDSLYELAPTIPLVTDLWENQQYATQIKLELIWWIGDIITFWGWLWEMFIAPLFTKGPDWEYQLQPNTDC